MGSTGLVVPRTATLVRDAAHGSSGTTTGSTRERGVGLARAEGYHAEEEEPSAEELYPEDVAATEQVSTYVVAEVAASSVAMLASGLVVGMFAGALLGALVVSGLLSSPCPSPELEVSAYRAMNQPLARA